MILKFNMIPDAAKLEALVQTSTGKVYLQISAERYCDLKDADFNLEQLFGQYEREKKQMTLHVFETNDYFRFVNYMIGVAYS